MMNHSELPQAGKWGISVTKFRPRPIGRTVESLQNWLANSGEIFGAIFINKLDIRLFGYSISERARAPILCEKGTVEYKSLADGLSRKNSIWTPKSPILSTYTQLI